LFFSINGPRRHGGTRWENLPKRAMDAGRGGPAPDLEIGHCPSPVDAQHLSWDQVSARERHARFSQDFAGRLVQTSDASCPGSSRFSTRHCVPACGKHVRQRGGPFGYWRRRYETTCPAVSLLDGSHRPLKMGRTVVLNLPDQRHSGRSPQEHASAWPGEGDSRAARAFEGIP